MDLILSVQKIQVTTNTTMEMKPNTEMPMVTPIRVLVSMEANEMQLAAGEKTIDSILHWMKNVLQYAFLNVNNSSRLQSMCRLTM